MKVRSGFVSNSSSSSFIVYGFGNSRDRQEMYDTVANILDRDSNWDKLSDYGKARRVETYLYNKGVDYFHYDYDNSDIECIGCELNNGIEEKFLESLEKAKKTLKSFDEEHGTHFADKAIITSDFVVQY